MRLEARVTSADIPDYGGDLDKLYAEEGHLQEMPTGQIQAAQGLKAENLTQPQQKKSGLSDILSAGKEAIGLGKDVYGLGKGAYDWLNKPTNAAQSSYVPGTGAWIICGMDTAATDLTFQVAILDSIGSGLGGLGGAISSGLGWLGRCGGDCGTMMLLPFLKDGGRVGYDDGGPVGNDIFNRGIIGAEFCRSSV
jgi:hypothetical protein